MSNSLASWCKICHFHRDGSDFSQGHTASMWQNGVDIIQASSNSTAGSPVGVSSSTGTTSPQERSLYPEVLLCHPSCGQWLWKETIHVGSGYAWFLQVPRVYKGRNRAVWREIPGVSRTVLAPVLLSALMSSWESSSTPQEKCPCNLRHGT